MKNKFKLGNSRRILDSNIPEDVSRDFRAVLLAMLAAHSDQSVLDEYSSLYSKRYMFEFVHGSLVLHHHFSLLSTLATRKNHRQTFAELVRLNRKAICLHYRLEL